MDVLLELSETSDDVVGIDNILPGNSHLEDFVPGASQRFDESFQKLLVPVMDLFLAVLVLLSLALANGFPGDEG